MKVLAIRQPWIDEIISGRKTIEVRTRNTNFRGRVALYSTRTKINVNDIDWVVKINNDDYIERSCPSEFEQGCIIGTVEIVGCTMPNSINQFASDGSKHRIPPTRYNYNMRYWHLSNPIRIDPIPFKMPKGAIIWSSIDDEMIE